ncbi:MAG: hypothetical protein EP347_09700 [Alphaproteobacteria bacterium]|nr:MAG: hypothetical protein EP347_09700 [Alphaproteobacteria bacterium]
MLVLLVSRFRMIICGMALCLLAQSAAASPPSSDLSLDVGAAYFDTNADDQRVLVVPVTVNEAPGATVSFRYFREEFTKDGVNQSREFSDNFVLDGPLTYNIELDATVPKEFGIRIIAATLEEDIPIGGSRAVQRYYRIGAADTFEEYSLQEFTEIRAIERKRSPGHVGLRATHRHGVYDPSMDVDNDHTSSDDLILNRPMLNIGSGDIEFKVESVEKDASAPEYVTIKGQLTTTINGAPYPLNFTRIDFWDKDPVKDDYLGSTRTDNDGNYVITVNNDDGPFGGGVDVYLYIYSNQSDITLLYLVPDGEGGYLPMYYVWTSPTHDDLDEKVVTINYNITDNNLAATVWAGAEAAAWFVESTAGKTLSHVEVRYPPFKSGTYYNNGIINIDPGHGDSPDTVGHEYGHAVMDQAYNGFPEGSGGAHCLCETASAGLAWSEGFATWYGLAAWGDSPEMTWHIGGPSVNIETWHCGPLDATKDEGRTAAWVWDLYDLPKDSNGSNTAYGKNGYWDSNGGDSLVGSRTLLNTLWLGKQNDTTAYWTALQGELTTAQKGPSTQISNYNYLIQ